MQHPNPAPSGSTIIGEGPKAPPRAHRDAPEIGVGFHVILGVLLGIVLAAASGPEFALWGFLAVLAIGLCIFVWGVVALGTVVRRLRGIRTGRLWWFAIAPVAGVMVLGMLSTDLPLQLRWAVGRGDFEKVAETAAPNLTRSQVRDMGGSRTIGTYPVSRVYQQGDAVIFRTGAGFADTGFAYLPTGAFPELENGNFESPHFSSIGGDWYTWSASW